MVAKSLDLLAIVGPTASGKTGLSIAMAKKYHGEIIAADSRTVYKYLNIGTAKPSIAEREGIVHWGFDIVGPGEAYSAAQFQKYAFNAIKDIKSRNKLPIIVGGSGLYIDSVLYNYSFVEPDQHKREQLNILPVPALQKIITEQKLQMPENSQNKRYLVRTIERGDSPIEKKELGDSTCIVGLNPDKDILAGRIKARAGQMIDDGVIDEIKQAHMLYPQDSEPLSGGIYKSFLPFINGTISKDDAVKHFVQSDLQLAKRQRTWFKRNPDIRWFEQAKAAELWLNNQYGGTL